MEGGVKFNFSSVRPEINFQNRLQEGTTSDLRKSIKYMKKLYTIQLYFV